MKNIFRVIFSPLADLTFAQRSLVLTILLFYRPLIRIETEEGSELPADPAIFVFNHSSSFETVVIAAYLMFVRRRKLRFVVDWVFGYLPVVGWIVRQVEPVFVYNKRARFSFMESMRQRSAEVPVWQQLSDVLAKRESIAIFPEGKRNSDPNFLKAGRSGVGRIAIDTGVPIFPIGIDFPRRIISGRVPKIGRIIFRIGKQLDLSPECHAAKILDETSRLSEGRKKRIRTYLDKKAVHRIMLELARMSGKKYPFDAPAYPGLTAQVN